MTAKHDKIVDEYVTKSNATQTMVKPGEIKNVVTPNLPENDSIRDDLTNDHTQNQTSSLSQHPKLCTIQSNSSKVTTG